MKELKIDEITGEIGFDSCRFARTFSFDEFGRQLAALSRLVMGEDGSASYALRETGSAFGQEFRVVLNFEKSALSSCTLLLISGPVRDRVDEYPDNMELTEEFDFLLKMYERIFKGQHLRISPTRHCWRYSWGDVVLVLQPQSASVLTEFKWK